MRFVLSGLAALSSTWTAGPPLIGPLDRAGEHFYSLKDPSVVRYQDRWHLFCTVRGASRSHQIEYLPFRDAVCPRSSVREVCTGIPGEP